MTDWKRGDEAVCIKRGLWLSGAYGLPRYIEGPQFMNVYVVTHTMFRDEVLWLGLKGYEGVWNSAFFRKPDPLELDEEDRETIDIMKGKEVEPS